MKRGLCSILVVGALLFCRYDSAVNPETYAQIDGIFDRREAIAGAQLVSLGRRENGSISVGLLDATPRQLEVARDLWPGIHFRSQGAFHNL
jgi:hypothetical protein